jgi:multiple sugar transport system ATP-binding protein
MEEYFLLGNNDEYGDFKFPLKVADKENAKPYLGKNIIFGVRPEHIKFTEEDGLKAQVLVTELLGSEVHIHLHVQGEIHTVKTDASVHIKAGDIIRVIPDPDKIHLFDPDTENAII